MEGEPQFFPGRGILELNTSLDLEVERKMSAPFLLSHQPSSFHSTHLPLPA